MLIPPEEAAGSVRASLPLWEAAVYLGDQCHWAICGLVNSRTEAEAIAEARQVIALAWPDIYEAYSLHSTPASAINLGPEFSRATPKANRSKA